MRKPDSLTASQFRYRICYNQEEVHHWFLPREGVINTYVVESEEIDPKTKQKKITDIISFYHLPSSVLKHEKYKKINAAYCYYNVATSVEPHVLMRNALIMAKHAAGCDVYNALNILDNEKAFKVSCSSV